MKKLFLLLLLSLSSTCYAGCNTEFWSEMWYPDYFVVEDANGDCQKVINPNANTSNSYSGNCACPYDTASDGSKCGARSAWSRSGGASPKCYVSSIQKAVDLADTPGAGMMYNARGIGRREGEAYEALGTLIKSLFNSFGK